MRILQVFLDIGHLGKRSAPGDLGASADLDRSGRLEADEHEALLALEYAGHAARELGHAGAAVQMWARGDYHERHRRARELAKSAGPLSLSAYIQCHLNVDAGYGLVCYDARSTLGAGLAGCIGSTLGHGLPELTSVRVEGASQATWTRRALATIGGIYEGPAWLTGICFEPASINVHREMLCSEGGPRRIGEALADGIIAWSAATP